jgi:hypothetical protein
MYINNFNNLINKYNYFLFDLWGVLYQNSSDKNIKGIEEINKIFSEIRKKKKYIYIVSNSSGNKINIKNLLKKIKIKTKYVNDIFTAGDYAINDLSKNKNYYQLKFGNRCFFNGKNKYIYNLLKKKKIFFFVNSINKADFIMGTSPDKKTLTLIKKVYKNKYFVCINADFLNIFNKRCMGWYANKYFLKGGKVFYFGKPLNLFNYLIKKKKLAKKKNEILCIGDSLYHDIYGSLKSGFHSLLIKKSIVYKTKIMTPNFIIHEKEIYIKPTYTSKSLKF